MKKIFLELSIFNDGNTIVKFDLNYKISSFTFNKIQSVNVEITLIQMCISNSFFTY